MHDVELYNHHPFSYFRYRIHYIVKNNRFSGANVCTIDTFSRDLKVND